MIDADLDRTIDRIVDGGLSPARLREAVARLDAAPDGWRRCALAFLEAQCWGDALRTQGPMLPAPRLVEPPTAVAPNRLRFVRPALAAASILAAFALGRTTGGQADRHDEPPAGPSMAQAAPVEPAGNDAKPDGTDEALPGPPSIRQVASLRLASGSPDAPVADVPILAGPGLGPDWLMRQPMPVSDYERAALERRGYALDQQRRLVAMPLEDGRRVVVPVDQVRLRYVGTDPL
jgi:hypothetical protein